jgi:hypothetical protein
MGQGMEKQSPEALAVMDKSTPLRKGNRSFGKSTLLVLQQLSAQLEIFPIHPITFNSSTSQALALSNGTAGDK